MSITKEQIENRPFEEIQIGESACLQQTLTEEQINLCAAVTGDLNPTHFDADYTGAGGPGGVVGHSVWGPGLVSNLLGNYIPGPGTVFRSQEIDFERPVRLGDTLTVTITAQEKHSDDQTVVFGCEGVNQNRELVFSGRAKVIAPKSKTVTQRPEMPGVTVYDRDAYEDLLRQCAGLDPVVTAVVHPCEETALRGALDAAESRLITPILVGPIKKIEGTAIEMGVCLEGLTIVDTEHSHAAAETAVELVRAGEAEILMKGSLHTDELMSAIVSSTKGLRTERRISHAFVMSVPTYPKPLIVTDAAINIAPDLDVKRDICQNAIDLAHVLGTEKPLVAILSAVETVSSKMPSTWEAAALCKMGDRQQITGGILDGPLAMDVAISAQAAQTKGIESDVAGAADILLAPDLEAGNILAKQLSFLANAEAAGIVLGARVPFVLTSRADSVRTRMASCAVAVLVAHARRGGRQTVSNHD